MARRRKEHRGRRRIDAALDARIGGLIRHRRSELGWSQQALGEKLGLTFQQVQKYENGTNQLSVARLLQLCGILHVPVGYFLEDTKADAPLAAPDYKTARAIAAIGDERVKGALGRLAQECARLNP